MARRYLQTGTAPSPADGGSTELATNASPVNVSSTAQPNVGDVLTATSGTDADWVAPAATGIVDDPTVRTTSFTAVAGTRYFIDSAYFPVVTLPTGPSDGDIVELVGIYQNNGNLVVYAPNNIRPAPGYLGTAATWFWALRGLQLAFKYDGVSLRWENISGAFSAMGANLGAPDAHAIMSLDSAGRTVRNNLPSGDSVPGRVVNGEIQELRP